MSWYAGGTLNSAEQLLLKARGESHNGPIAIEAIDAQLALVRVLKRCEPAGTMFIVKANGHIDLYHANVSFTMEPYPRENVSTSSTDLGEGPE